MDYRINNILYSALLADEITKLWSSKYLYI